jgi:hypothetical protein
VDCGTTVAIAPDEMKNKARFGMKFIRLFFCVAACLMGSGCMSSRVTTDLKPGKDPSLTAPGGTFYIANVKLVSSTPQMAQSYGKLEPRLLKLLRKESMERYPSLFVSDSTYALPLGVEVEITTTMHNLKTVVWMYGTLLICGTILPAPGDTDEDLTVNTYVWSGRSDSYSATIQQNFRRENHTWVTLLTPIALIPIPGETDFPKVSGSLFNMQSMEDAYLQQLAPQIATALAKMVAAKEADFWTAQPRWNNAPALTPATQPAPTVLPMPTDTVAPF